jgi:hypothetical protein
MPTTALSDFLNFLICISVLVIIVLPFFRILNSFL